MKSFEENCHFLLSMLSLGYFGTGASSKGAKGEFSENFFLAFGNAAASQKIGEEIVNSFAKRMQQQSNNLAKNKTSLW